MQLSASEGDVHKDSRKWLLDTSLHRWWEGTTIVTVLRDEAQNIEGVFPKSAIFLVKLSFDMDKWGLRGQRKETFQKFLVCNHSSTSIKISSHAAKK